MKRGPLEFVVVEFTGGFPGRRLGPELHRLVDQEIVRIIDMVVVDRAADGTVTSHELSAYEGDAEFEAIDAAIQAVDGLISEQDVHDLAETIRPGAKALVLLFEHLWLSSLRTVIDEAGGEIVMAERIPGPVVDAIEEAAVAAGGRLP
ncbi:DUF6325 family protein [Catellatospora bangladeshensis]|uniref:DUF1269 domain-containing protein n=1 Tax=Catellatospora bangladeshensis TaxID=310355 RepID=A0A8J3J803_9ACTN|nr:DUF6325 family protein [Catellatospora bangladeshensis]GIF79817.1 hypothetical protein Cba03nite_11660 [Catellatospora bangladeshensis]